MTCELHSYHRPEPQGTERHHVLPLTWTRALDLPESRTVRICGTGHSNLHHDLRAALRGQPYRAGTTSRALIDEAVEFYEAHPEAQHYLWTLADQLVAGMSIQLRDGSTVDDPRLDRLVQFDERSRAYPIRELVAAKPFRSYTWRAGAWLDQGSEGACVGFAWAHELAARPWMVAGVDDDLARRRIYRRAQQIDEWPGEAYSGTSVLAGAKACVELDYIREYRWAFGLDDLRLALGYKGPAVLGVAWFTGMFTPDAEGRIQPTGGIAGGHAILAYRVDEKRGRVWLQNSWGRGWGIDGTCWLTFDDLARLLEIDGEACIPVVRRR